MKKIIPERGGASKICLRRSAMAHVHKVAGNLLYNDIVFAFAVAERERGLSEIANTVMETSHRTLRLRVHKAKGKNTSLRNPETNFREKRFQKGQSINGEEGGMGVGAGMGGGVSF